MRSSGWLLVLVLFLAVPLSAQSGEIALTTSVSPQRIGLEDRLQLTVSFQAVGNPPEPDLSVLRDFEPVPGVVQRGTEFIMNNAGSTLLTRFMYQLRPKRIGKLTIPALSVQIDGRTYRSQPLTVEVVKGRLVQPSRPAIRRLPGFFDDPLEELFAEPETREPELFVRAVPSKQKIFQGEAVVMSFELLTRDQVDEKRLLRAASVPGFWVEWIDPYNAAPGRSEMVDGKAYTVVEIDRGIFIPQRSGPVQLPPFEYAFLVTPRSARGAFFTQRRQVIRKSAALTIEVQALPREAEGLPVGRYQLTLSARPLSLNVNDLLTLNLVISGSGNIKSVQVPELPAIDGLKAFPAKIDRRNLNQNGDLSGELTAEIPISVSRVGNIDIPPLVFRYFDPQTATIQETASEPLRISVGGQAGSHSSANGIGPETVKKTGDDIDYLLAGPFSDEKRSWLNGPLFPVLLLVPFLLPLGLLVRRWLLVPLRMRWARGDKALQRQTQLNKLTDSERSGELLPLLDGLLTDVLAIRPSQLNRAALQRELDNRKLSEQMSRRLLDHRDALQAMRFAGGALPAAELQQIQKELHSILAVLIGGGK